MGTFYYYYADIFDLLEDIEKDMKATAIKELIPIIKSLLNGKDDEPLDLRAGHREHEGLR